MGEAEDPLDEARRGVAERLRTLADHLASGDLGVNELDQLQQALGPLLPAPEDGPISSWFGRAIAVTDAPEEAHDRHAFARGQSAVYPPIDLELDGTKLVATTRLGAAWEGPPGVVHGGFLAAGFDMACSSLAAAMLGPSVTRSLHTRYLTPTFLGAELRYEIEAGPVDGRLLELRGRLFADGTVTLRGHAQFAALAADRFRDRRARPPADLT